METLDESVGDDEDDGDDERSNYFSEEDGPPTCSWNVSS